MMRRAGAALAVVFAAACQCQVRIVQPATPIPHDIVALLRDPETKAVGRAVVSSASGGSVELTHKREATRIVVGQPPSAPFRFSQDQIDQLFGEALAALPPAPRHFLLYFDGGSNQLTPASEKLIPEILVFVRNRPVPDVTVVGHTDTTGAARDNIELARSWATMVRDRLVAAGLDASLVSVVSHGEADLLVPTPDDTPNSRNRRVEVSVR
jgi:outer membrane protein OmpA-like peptidoglycan-associated protein